MRFISREAHFFEKSFGYTLMTLSHRADGDAFFAQEKTNARSFCRDRRPRLSDCGFT